MASQDECARLLRRVTRDLQAPMAALVALHPRRMVIADRGFDQPHSVQRLASVDPGQYSDGKGLDLDRTQGFRSWAAVGVQHDGIEVGNLVVADRRRRWFDHDEFHHLHLMTSLAGTLITELAPLMTELVDVRVGRTAALT